MKKLMFLVLTLILLMACAACTLLFRTDHTLSSRASGQQADLAEETLPDEQASRTPQEAEGSPSSSEGPTLTCIYFNEKIYETAKQQAEAYSVSGTVMGGIIPHHGIAAKMTASFFETLSESYDTVILIGPNHYEEGGAVVYSDCGWHTEKGGVGCDGEFVEPVSYTHLTLPTMAVV